MAVTKKSTKPPAPKKRAPQVSFDFSAWQKNFKKSWQKSPSLYTLGTTIMVVIIALGLLFWFQRSLFLAGNINGRLITTPQFYSKLAKSGGEEVFQSIVQDTLIKQEAAKKGVSVSEKEIKAKLKELEDRLGGPEALKSALAQNNTTITDLREQIVTQVLAEKLLAEKIKVTEAEVQKYIKENKQAAVGLTKEQVKQTLRSQKLSQEFGIWFEEVKKKANIQTYFK